MSRDCILYLLELLKIVGKERTAKVVELSRDIEKEQHEEVEYFQLKKENSNWI